MQWEQCVTSTEPQEQPEIANLADAMVANPGIFYEVKDWESDGTLRPHGAQILGALSDYLPAGRGAERFELADPLGTKVRYIAGFESDF